MARISAADRTFAKRVASDGKISAAEARSLEKRGFNAAEIRALRNQAADGERNTRGRVSEPTRAAKTGPVAHASIAPLVAIVGGAAARTLVSRFGAPAATGAAKLLYRHGGRASRAADAAHNKYTHQGQRSAVIDAIRGAKRLKVSIRIYRFSNPFTSPGDLGGYRRIRVR